MLSELSTNGFPGFEFLETCNCDGFRGHMQRTQFFLAVSSFSGSIVLSNKRFPLFNFSFK